MRESETGKLRPSLVRDHIIVGVVRVSIVGVSYFALLFVKVQVLDNFNPNFWWVLPYSFGI